MERALKGLKRCDGALDSEASGDLCSSGGLLPSAGCCCCAGGGLSADAHDAGRILLLRGRESGGPLELVFPML